MRRSIPLLISMLVLACVHRVPGPMPQAASPMIEATRVHGRIAEHELAGQKIEVDAGLPAPVSLYIPARCAALPEVDLVVHFHGAAFLPFQAVDALSAPVIAASIQLGAGSSRYEQPFLGADVFPNLLTAIERSSGKHVRRIFVTSFSAGYGAVRAILRNHPDRIDGILLLDSLHTGYLPDGKPLGAGGVIESAKLEGFRAFAEKAKSGERLMIITHSEVFPGTFASTTETADYLLTSLGMKRTPVLAWGPNGMQQTSEAQAGRLLIRGFAGNTGPDHVDHLHALPALLPMLLE